MTQRHRQEGSVGLEKSSLVHQSWLAVEGPGAESVSSEQTTVTITPPHHTVTTPPPPYTPGHIGTLLITALTSLLHKLQPSKIRRSISEYSAVKLSGVLPLWQLSVCQYVLRLTDSSQVEFWKPYRGNICLVVCLVLVTIFNPIPDWNNNAWNFANMTVIKLIAIISVINREILSFST